MIEEKENKENKKQEDSPAVRFDIKAFHMAKLAESDVQHLKKEIAKITQVAKNTRQSAKDARIWAMIAMLIAVFSLSIYMLNLIVTGLKLY